LPTIVNEEVVQKYIAGCRRRDRKSQYALFKYFHSYAMGICRRYAHQSDEASDILNEGFLKVFNHIERYDGSKPFKSWIGKIITNTAIDHYRVNLKFAKQEDVDHYDHVGDDAAIYGELAYDDLLAMVRSLSPAYRTVFNLYAIDGYSHNEIAELLGITTSTSKSNLHKARKKLQELVEKTTSGKRANGGKDQDGTHHEAHERNKQWKTNIP